MWAAAASNMQPIGFLPSAGEDLARYVAAGELSPRDLLLVRGGMGVVQGGLGLLYICGWGIGVGQGWGVGEGHVALDVGGVEGCRCIRCCASVLLELLCALCSYLAPYSCVLINRQSCGAPECCSCAQVLWCYASSRTYQERLLAAVKLALWHAMELDLEHQKELGREQQGRGRRQQQQQQQPSQRLPDLTAVGELGTDERGVYEAVVRSRRAAAALLREVKKRPGVRGKGGQADGVLAGMQAGKDGGSKAAGLILACFQRLGFDPGPRLGSWLKSLAG